jgi:hypothetical protein
VTDVPDEGNTSEPFVEDERPRRGWAWWLTRGALVVLPLLLAIVAYYPAQLAGAPLPRPDGDAALYAYQLIHAAEEHGRWWRAPFDERLGSPYPTEIAKHPGVYEGVDLMLLATASGGSLGAILTYHLAVLAVLAVNGWIAGWIVLRITRSAGWAAIASTLITLNQSVAARILGHLHLFKFGWVLLAVWAFVAYLEKANWRRAVFLGASVALVLQGSYYLGFFVMIGLGSWSLVEGLSGRLQRSHLTWAACAGLVFVVLGALSCFPVWTGRTEIVAGGQYFQREWYETWHYGAELWKYLVPRGSWLAQIYYRDVRMSTSPPNLDEGWHFPGYTVLGAVLLAGVSRLRGRGVYPRLGRFTTGCLGLLAGWTVLSLAGGPSALLYFVVPSFRCYGRAGLLVVATGSVVAPIILCELVRGCRRRLARVLLVSGIIAVVAGDAWIAARSFHGWGDAGPAPAWVTWLKDQPPEVRLAAFALPEGKPFVWWGMHALTWLPVHQHATLNGSDFSLFEGDLRLLGGSYERMNPAGLRLVVSLGYDTLAFDEGYLAANSWITSLSWLERIDTRGEWEIFRARPTLARFAARSFESVLNEGRRESGRRRAPAGSWISGSWPVRDDVVVSNTDWALLGWTDNRGRLLGRPRPALFQHVFGPSIPAYVARTPSRPGPYRLTIFDHRLKPRATIDYDVVAGLAVSQPEFPARRPGLTSSSVIVRPASSSSPPALIDVSLVNTSTRYVQAQVFREHLSGVAQSHPGLRPRWPKAGAGGLVLHVAPAGRGDNDPDGDREIPLPADLAPGERLHLTIPVDRLPPYWVDRPLEIEPGFSLIGHVAAAPGTADLRISIGRAAIDVAGPATSELEPKR